MRRLRDVVDQARDRLLFLPALCTVAGFLGAIVMVAVDQLVVDAADVPQLFQTSVDGSRQVLSTIAGGLITAYALMLSLLLVTVQLAAGQLSPRTLRNWLGDRTLQRALGLVVGTVVFCLVVLYQTRSFGEADNAFRPHASVLVAIVLGIASLVVVLRAVDHLADSMRIGSVARIIMDETVELIRRQPDEESMDRPGVNPATRPVSGTPVMPPQGAHVLEADTAAWVQTIDLDRLLDACPDGSEVHVPVAVGSFVLSRVPLAWVDPPPPDAEAFDRRARRAFAMGHIRTMQQDVGFGIVRLVDVALHALSPSLNDANTGKDVISHLGEVVLAVLERPERTGVHHRDGRRVRLTEYSHREYVHAAFDQIRQSAMGHPQVLQVLLRTLLTVRQEIDRRDLPASHAVIDELLTEILDEVETAPLSNRDRYRVLAVLPAELRHLARTPLLPASAATGA